MAKETKNQTSNNEKEVLQNITKTEEGYLLTGEQIIKLANHIEQLRAKNEKLKAELKEAEKQLEKSYNEEDGIFDLRRLSDGITGAGIASLLILIATGMK